MRSQSPFESKLTPLLLVLKWRFEVLVFTTTNTIVPRRLIGSSGHLRVSLTIVLSSTLLAIVGCGDSQETVSPTSNSGSATVSLSAETKEDFLADLLQRVRTGDIDTAIQQFVTSAPNNWIESTSLEDFRMSESSFDKLDRVEKVRVQQQFIDRVGELKGFARTVIDRANEAKQKGDMATAEQYLEAIHRLGRQLRDSDTVIVYQQIGKALAEMKLSE